MRYSLQKMLSGLGALLLTASLGAAVAGCEEPETGIQYQGRDEIEDPVKVVDVSLGKDVGDDKQVTRPTQTFEPNDTVFVSITMEGTDDDVWLSTRWFHEREVIHTARHRNNLTGSHITEMHLRTPDDLPEGRYTVEVSLYDEVVATKQFQVVAGGDDGEGS